ncbi:esophageal gland cell secretory protein 21, partial [Aphelenchoides avenae]
MNLRERPFLIAFLLPCWCVGVLGQTERDELLLVQAIWRHGLRAPYKSFPNDPYQLAPWKNKSQSLTLIGMQQQVKLGQWLKKRYIEDLQFLSAHYDSNEVYVRSSDTERTILSAMANMIGMYAESASAGVDYPDAFEWPAGFVPIPVHTVHADKDAARIWGKRCPVQHQLERLVLQTPEYRALVNRTQGTMDRINEITGGNYTAYDAWQIKQVLEIEESFGLKVPEWSLEMRPWLDAIDSAEVNISNAIGVAPFRGVDLAFEMPKVKGGPLLWELIGRMKVKAKCQTGSGSDFFCKLKFLAYSAHDMPMAALLRTLGMPRIDYDRDGYTDFCTIILVEQWRIGGTNNSYVKVLYRRMAEGTLLDITKDVKGCDVAKCPLEVFVARSLKYQPIPDAEG